MKYFLDTEFIERPCTIELVSIGIVSEDGREFYAEDGLVDLSKGDQWFQENVVPHLIGPEAWMDKENMGPAIREFVGKDKPEFWAYYADYDWVVFCWLFGRMIDLPKGWPMYCRDLKQWADSLGGPRLPEQGKDEHDALADARWNKKAWEHLSRIEADMFYN